MKIALVFPPVYGVDFPHLGLAYIASQLKSEGHNIKVFCFNSRLYKEAGDKKRLWDWQNANLWLDYQKIKENFDIEDILDKWADEILDFGAGAIGFSVNTHSKLIAEKLTAKIKKKQQAVKVVFGGPFCSVGLDSGDMLNKDVDVYVRGEGEYIASQVFNNIGSGQPLSGIKGVVINNGSGFFDSGASGDPFPVDKIPFPGFEFFDLNSYENKREIPIIFSRGCNYYCRFCCDKPIWGGYRMRSAENIAGEIKDHKEKFGRSAFKSNDLMINGDLSELERLADLLIKENFNITWGGMARARKDMTGALLKKLKASGCAYLTFGIESGSSRVLRHMGKPLADEVSITLKRVHEAGIKTNTLWIVGYPTETMLDFLKTLLFLFKNRKHIDEFVNVSMCYIPQNSILQKQSEMLGIKYDNCGNWYIDKRRNNHAVRKRRAFFIKLFAKSIGLYKGGIRRDN